MFSLLSGVPGVDEVRAFVRKVDTARHQGVANGCILELDLQNAPPESAGFDPVAVLSGIVGSGRVSLRDHDDAVAILLSTGVAGVFDALVVGSDCTTDNPSTISRTTVGN